MYDRLVSKYVVNENHELVRIHKESQLVMRTLSRGCILQFPVMLPQFSGSLREAISSPLE